ncbi:Vacuolar ATP synthase subunit d [Giardia muris]|uniref:Vacuolar ATP synthase subunit d n=1 Tax=Giardia muris TaxID=5742 RepID=A0A4Z1SQJ2_GIAMU|nr:Vacuolar ATP synthase subunit d [Giardia muris]|eukprot:TNJ28122.1 Vacuolar ATP synthase subunit d [Giardia muris]
MTTNIACYNIDFGIVEADVRANPEAFISNAEYLSLAQLTSPEDFCSTLATITGLPISVGASASDIKFAFLEALKARYVDLLPHAEGAAEDFLLFIKVRYFINNAFILLSAAMKSRTLSTGVRLHPLGEFVNLEHLTEIENFSEVFATLLEVSPAGPYFLQAGMDPDTFRIEDVTPLEFEQLKAKTEARYLEDFHRFCLRLGGLTAEVMNEILTFEADQMTTMIALNTLGNDDISPDVRMEMMPKLGNLYPYLQERLLQVGDMEGIRSILSEMFELKQVLDHQANDSTLTLLDAFAAESVTVLRNAFREQFCFGAIYAYFRLKEIETSNVIWMYECLLGQRYAEMRKYVQIF